MLHKVENINISKPSVILISEDHNLSENFLRVYKLIYKIKIFNRNDLFYDRINEYSPDIIILSIMSSDNIDGLMILNSLISNSLFNSVPIIALIEDETDDYIQLVLEKGACDYLTKGRFFNLIRYKINALIRINNYILNKINKDKNVQKNDLIIDHDKAILSNFIDEVNNHIEKDTNISVNDIAKNLHVTLNYLERKVKLAFAKGPRRYILDKRLEKADFLLKSKKASIKNIAFEVGFNSTAYFTKCYRLKYGKTPKTTQIDLTYN
jgi:AraC-like DNA-binding protein